jgi:O-antigen/teichoic acid export membrane protein
MIKRLLSNRIIKNFSILTGTNISIQFLSVLSSIRVARLLQPQGYGLFNLMIVQASLFSVIATFGLSLVIIRYVARNKSDSKNIFHISNKIRLVSTLLAVLSLLIYNIFINKTSITPLFLFLLSTYIIFQSFWDSIQSIAFGNERMEASGYINLIFTGLWVISVYVIPKINFNIEILLTIYVFSQIIKTISYYFWLNKKIFRKEHSSIYNADINIKSIIRQSNYYFILAIFTALQNQVPILLLNQTSKLDQVGIFNLGNRILSPMQMALGMALTSLYPSLSRLAFTNKELFTERIKNLMNFLVIIGVWGCICFTLFSKEVVLLLYGKAYLDSAKVILIQCWFTMLYSIFCTIGMVLSSYDKQRTLAILSIIYGILALPIFYMGAKYGAIGLAWAFVIAAYINMTYHWIVFKNLLSPYLTFNYSFKLFSIIILATICSLFVPFEYNFIIKIVVGISVTIIAGYYLKNKVIKKVLL